MDPNAQTLTLQRQKQFDRLPTLNAPLYEVSLDIGGRITETEVDFEGNWRRRRGRDFLESHTLTPQKSSPPALSAFPDTPTTSEHQKARPIWLNMT